MKHLLFFTLTLALLSCNPTSVETASSPETELKESSTRNDEFMNELTEYLAPEKQAFQVEPKEENTIIGKKGTKIVFPADCFEFEDGTPVIESIDLTIKECYDLSDFIAEGLQTRVGDDFLETGGMIYLEGFSEGKPVKIKSGETYELYIPKNGSNFTDMQTFYGTKPENGIVNWRYAEDIKRKIQQSRASRLNQTRERTTTTDIESSFARRKRPKVKLEKYGGDTTKIFIECSERPGIFVPPGKTRTTLKLATEENQTLISYFNDNFNPSLDMLNEFFVSHHTPIVGLNFNEEGKIVAHKFYSGCTQQYEDSIAKFLYEAPPLDSAELHDPNVMHFYHLSFKRAKMLIKLNEEEPDSLNQNTLAENEANSYEQFVNTTVGELSVQGAEYYLLQAGEMGWINCDRLNQYAEPRDDFFVTVDDPQTTRVKLVFTDVNSCMHATPAENNSFVFRNIPMGIKVRLIGIRADGTQSEMAIKDTYTTTSERYLHEFKPFTLQEMVDAMNSI